ncbi:MAG: cell elongation-specific peptidoglycan D,D-transpeptidase [Frankiales bacterium]|nr:cell elongation-specific peptidoglycan D,D-transpeptidase [Frankiales bacterium]MCW2706947.1 cell elongation-specific peptidoglycan D,D-transpeptidase [Frankiales bacterium]
MNRPLRRVAAACVVLFGLLLLQVNWIQVVKAKDYRNDPRNRRVLLRTYDRERGPIVVGSGKSRLAVAKSTVTTDALKYLRVYPGGAVYAPVTGFASFVYGYTGIERQENSVLSGDDERLLVRRLSDYITGRQVKGGTVELTLQDKAQQAAWAGLKGKRGAVVALDPRTGAVLAEATSPSYDPATVSSHNGQTIRQAYQALLAAAGQPMTNRGVQNTYPPGSTFKVITAAAALAHGYTPSTRIPSPTVLNLPGTTANLGNFGGEHCGDGQTDTLLNALEISCNTAFGALGMKLGQDVVRQQAEAFGFGDSSLDLPQPVATSVFPDGLTQAQTAQSAIGQFDVRVTPLQMAMVAAGIGNHGDVMAPYLVKDVLAPDLSQLGKTDPKLYKHAVSASVASQLRTMMEAVVLHGTGTAAQISGVSVAGKTGTAQHGPGAAPHAWFIGFAPAVNPIVAVAVLVEDGGSLGSDATGGKVAAPIAKAVMEAVLHP